MSVPEPDVAQQIADSWARVRGTVAPPEDFWACCQVLADGGLLIGQQQDLAAISLGPFKLATSKFGTPAREFVEVLIPGVIGSLPAGATGAGAATGALTAAATCLIKLLNEGVVFRSTPDDVLRWAVLVFIKSSNDDGVEPTRAEVLAYFRSSGSSAGWADEEVETAVTWLLDGDFRAVLGSPSPLVREVGGHLRSRV
ncbi:hypothetical protein ACIG56_26660 [Nocardia fusca]|uniref:hypothetical protein n=1 Tax=Nocardia fusca TaxID=941183 RepID=UPI0037C8E4D7